MAMLAGDALAGTGMAGAIYASIVANAPAFVGSPANALSTQKLCNAIAAGVVAHIAANAVVTVTSVSGVTAGAGVSGPGAGTVT